MNFTARLLEIALFLTDKIGYLGVFLALVLDNCGIPIPSEATLALAGSLSRTGRFNLVLILVLGIVAQTAGTYLAYLIGWHGGEPLVKRYGKYVLISAHDYDRAKDWFARRGERAVFVSRLIPVIRTYGGFAAGTFRMNRVKFLRDSFLGSTVWTLAFVLAGYALGDSWRHYYSYLHYVDYLVIVVLVVLLARYIYLHIKRRNRKER